MKDYDIETRDSGLYHAALYFPQHTPSFDYMRKLERLNNNKREYLLKELEKIMKTLMKEYDIPKNLIEIDREKVRILTSVEIAKTLKDEIKDFGLKVALVEELPTFEKNIMQLEWI